MQVGEEVESRRGFGNRWLPGRVIGHPENALNIGFFVIDADGRCETLSRASVPCVLYVCIQVWNRLSKNTELEMQI